MIYLRTGLPGASKTLNSLKELVHSYEPSRPFYYHNIRLLILDIDVACSFSGWYYGWYFPRLTDQSLKAKLIKIMKPIHDNDAFLTLDDVPFLRSQFEAHSHFQTWLHWVRKVYPKEHLKVLEDTLDLGNTLGEYPSDSEMFDLVRPLNLHFTHFDDPNYWFDLPKGSKILIDECQQFFPPRQQGSRVPQAIGQLETHRHGGYDLHFITQDPLLVDQNLRRLVGRHVHFFNPFGGKTVTRKESPEVFNPKDYHQNKQATKTTVRHPVEFYGVYYSAEIHTHKLKLPKKLILLLVLPICIGLAGWYLYDSLFGSKESPSKSEFVKKNDIPEKSNSSSSSRSSSASTKKVPKTVSELVTLDSPLAKFAKETLEGVYINGSMFYSTPKRGVSLDYSFVRASDGSVFHPFDVGFSVEPINKCLANIVISDVRIPVTCNPFYKRDEVPVNDGDQPLEPETGKALEFF